MKMKLFGMIALSMILLGAAPSLAASEPEPPKDSGTFLQRMEKSHEALSREIQDLSERLDMFLGGDRTCEVSKGSLIQAGVSTVWRKVGGFAFDRILNAQIDLPQAQNRYRLLLESDPEKNFREQLSPGASSTTETQNLTAQGPGQNFSAAIQYVVQERMKWAASLDAGVDVQYPPDPFGRAKAKRSFTVADWRFTIGETLFWFVSLGPGATTQFEVEKYVPTSFCESLFRMTTSITWRERSDGYGLDLGQSFSWHQELSSWSVLTYKAGIAGEAKEKTQVNDWGLGVEYRRRLHKDWLYLSLEPAITFSRANDFEANPSLRFTVDVSFGGKFYK